MYSTAREFLYKDYSQPCRVGYDGAKLPEGVYQASLEKKGKEEYSDPIPPLPQLIDAVNKPIPKKTLIKEEIKVPDNADPKVWGKYFWTQLHLAATYYPNDPSPIFREKMKGRILAIPYEVPCTNCRNHALAFLEKNEDNLDDIVSSKEKLGTFYVKFHNYVNERFGKASWTYEQALKHYSNKNFKLT